MSGHTFGNGKKLKVTSRLLGKEPEYFDNEVDFGIWNTFS